jgi:uncharacterized protein (DUF1810 family)
MQSPNLKKWRLHSQMRQRQEAVMSQETEIDDPFNLNRFVSAQAPVWSQVLTELRAGAKRSHWIWFIFPQMKGLGHSPTADHFGIGSLKEAEAYARHPLLGPRLIQCTQLVNFTQSRTINQILGSPDDLKFRSSMTLFARAAPDNTVFHDALKKYFNGQPDPLTLELLL